jgi:hypothetical protein
MHLIPRSRGCADMAAPNFRAAGTIREVGFGGLRIRFIGSALAEA